MAGLVYAPNQLNPHDGRIYRTIQAGTILRDAVADFSIKGLDLDIIVNGKRKTDLEYVVRTGDHVTVAVHLSGGGDDGGKGVLRAIAMIILVVTATIFLGPTSGAAVATSGIFGSAAIASTVLTGAAILAGSMIINAILPLNLGNGAKPMGNAIADSNTYGWSPSANQVNEGLTAPVLYGKTRITPQVIAQYRSYDAGRDTLNVLFHLTEGESSAITEIKVNNIPIADVSVDGSADYTYRQGALTQSRIEEFSDSIFETTVNQVLAEEADEIIVTTDGNAVEHLAVGVVLNGGLYTYSQGYGELKIGYRIEFRVAGSSDSWTQFSGQSDTLVRNIYSEYDLQTGWYNNRVYTNNRSNTTRFTLFATEALALAGDPNGKVFPAYTRTLDWHDITEVQTAGAGFYHSAKSPDTLRFRHVHNATLTPAQYEIRITRLVSYPFIVGSTSYANNMTVAFLQEIVEGGFTYPYTSILGLRAIATDKIYGGAPAISMVLDRGDLSHYDGEYGVGVPTLHDSGNPAWACYDILTNPMYGAGVSPTRMILADFQAWADFCDTKGLRCNVYLDTYVNTFEAINQISTLGYGSVVPRGTSIGCIYEDASDMVYTFGMGNILAGTFNMKYIDRTNRANVIEVTYYDEDLEYDRRILVVRDSGTENDKDIVAPIALVGCTNRVQARNFANRLIRSNIYNLRIVTFEADVDAIHCQVGDIVGVAHDVPQYGYSGRTMASDSTTMDLGAPVFLEAAKSYAILIRHNDDTLESKDLASPPVDGDYQTVEVDSGTWGVNPEYMSTWNIAEIATGVKKFRILSISKSQDFVARITALEYHEEIMSDGDSIPDFESDTLLQSVVGLSAYVNFRRETDGAIKAQIQVDWRGVSTEWRVNVSRSDGYSDPAWNTYVTRPSFSIGNILPRSTDTYTITVTGLDGDSASATVDMIIDPPQMVDQIKVNVIDQFVLVNYIPPFSEARINRYEIYKGVDFLEATKVATSTSNFVSFQEADYGTVDYWIVAVNEFDGVSQPFPFTATIEGSTNFQSLTDVYLEGTGSGTDYLFEGGLVLGPIGALTTTWEEILMDLYPVDYATKTMDDIAADFGYATLLDFIGATSDGQGDYTEVIDLGVEYPKAEYRLSVEKIKGTSGTGTAEVVASLEVSNDGVGFYSDFNSLAQIGLGVRYLRIHLEFTGDGDTAIWAKPKVEVLTKTIKQEGKVAIVDASAGLLVPFTTDFVDVTGIKITPKTTEARYAVYDFDDIPNPTGFTVWLFDDTGVKVTGSLSYTVTGI